MKILFLNNDGEGHAGNVDITDGMTVGQFLEAQVGSVDPSRYTLRVNRETVSMDHVLQAGDKFTLTPSKIAGAF